LTAGRCAVWGRQGAEILGNSLPSKSPEAPARETTLTSPDDPHERLFSGGREQGLVDCRLVDPDTGRVWRGEVREMMARLYKKPTRQRV
jgi:hypothetical protein